MQLVVLSVCMVFHLLKVHTAAFNHGMVQIDSGGNMPSGAGSIMMYIANTSIRFLYQTNTGHNDLDASHCVDGTAFYGFATYFTS